MRAAIVNKVDLDLVQRVLRMDQTRLSMHAGVAAQQHASCRSRPES